MAKNNRIIQRATVEGDNLRVVLEIPRSVPMTGQEKSLYLNRVRFDSPELKYNGMSFKAALDIRVRLDKNVKPSEDAIPTAQGGRVLEFMIPLDGDHRDSTNGKSVVLADVVTQQAKATRLGRPVEFSGVVWAPKS